MAGTSRWARRVRDRFTLSRKPARYGTTALCVAPGVTPPQHQLAPAGPDSASSAVQACQEAIQVLNKQELSLQSQVTIAETEARALLRLGDRSAAETSLKKREIVLREIDRLHRTRMSLLSQILLVETASTRQIAVEALASGVAAHRKISGRLFEETQLGRLEEALIEQASFETEVSELLGQGFEALTSFDDETNANLKKSLQELEQDEVINAIAETQGFQGICSAESYQGTSVATAHQTYANTHCVVEEMPSPRDEKYSDLTHTMMSTMAPAAGGGMEGLELAGMN